MGLYSMPQATNGKDLIVPLVKDLYNISTLREFYLECLRPFSLALDE